jgi:hypothetical protein
MEEACGEVRLRLANGLTTVGALEIVGLLAREPSVLNRYGG